MNPPKHFVVFSHGFGVRKDARGLFSDIAAALSGVETVLFDYNEINEAENTITIGSFSGQAEMLQDVLHKIRSSAPEATVDLVCHSQGAIIAALALPEGIRKTVLLAPPINMQSERMLTAFRSRPGSTINMDGISRIARRDGSTTIVLPEYWSERKNLRPIELYNKLAERTELIVIKANQDEVLDVTNFHGLDSKINVVSLDGDHNFTGVTRRALVEAVKSRLV